MDADLSGYFQLQSPATPERIRMACQDQFTNLVSSAFLAFTDLYILYLCIKSWLELSSQKMKIQMQKGQSEIAILLGPSFCGLYFHFYGKNLQLLVMFTLSDIYY